MALFSLVFSYFFNSSYSSYCSYYIPIYISSIRRTHCPGFPPVGNREE